MSKDRNPEQPHIEYGIIATIRYIWKHGWAEYRAARARYENHMRLQGYGDARYSKLGEQEMRKIMERRRKR